MNSLRGKFNVILQLPGQAPSIVASGLSHTRASALVWMVAEAHRHIRRTRVYIQLPDSRDQLQVSQRGVVIRDQPDLPATGEHKVIHAPIASARAKASTPR